MHDLHKIITAGIYNFPSSVEPILTYECKNLISKMLMLNPSDRISIPEILSHPWMMNSEDMLSGDDYMDDLNNFSNKEFMMGPHGNNEGAGAEPDINEVNIDNLFEDSTYSTKLSYTDYCAITQDFATMHMDEEAL